MNEWPSQFSEMVHWVDLLLKGSYLYGHFIGVSNFELDWRTGRVFSTARSNLYAVVNNGFIVFLLVSFLHQGLDFDARLFNAHKLIESVVIIMTVLRISAGVVTVFSRWSQRCEIKNLVRNVISLVLAKPQLIQMSRWGILIKAFTGFMTDLIHLFITYDEISLVGSKSFMGFFFQYWMAALLNLALSQHFLVLLLARAQYQLLNTELRQVIDECKHLSHHRERKGTFMTRCCHLADKLEDVGKNQNKLQAIIKQLGEIFAIQGVMVYSGYYISSVSVCYLTYSIVKSGIKQVGLSQRMIIFTSIWGLFFYLDALVNLFIILHVQDDHKEMIRLLEERTLFASGLDVRLEESFESLQLQLIRNPLKMEVMKLFSTTRSATAAMVGSLISHSIYLVQYDMEHF